VTGLKLAIKGMLLGNLLGIGMALFQYYTKWVKLDYETYFMRYVPVELDWMAILKINGQVFLLVLAFIYIPTLIISSIKPVQSIKFS
jgi:lipoprotein-releasing system permease protein